MEVTGKIVDPVKDRVFCGRIRVKEGKISEVEEVKGESKGSCFIVPPLVDSHVHIESSLLTPSGFAYLTVPNGILSAIADPHEIANVLGVEGVLFMIEEAGKVPAKLFFSAPSCVPASEFSKAGAALGVKEVGELLKQPRIKSLGEVMDFPSVIKGRRETLEKIKKTQEVGKPIDGHAPGLRGEDARAYFGAGISTDHESTSLEEALEKLSLGVHIQIREGSAARNFQELMPLLSISPEKVMFCTDDRSADDLEGGSINQMVERALREGFEVLNVFKAASVNPVRHYKLPLGLLQPGDPADFLVLESLIPFRVKEVICNGRVVAREGKPLFKLPNKTTVPNTFACDKVSEERLKVKAKGKRVKVIVATDGSLITKSACSKVKIVRGEAIPDPSRDILKVVLVNRYGKSRIGVGFIRGFGMKRGAIAMSIAHDHHNIIGIGTSDRLLVWALNRVIEMKGGISVTDGNSEVQLELPVAGLMTQLNPKECIDKLRKIKETVKQTGCPMRNPLITLSFMALEVIPELKITDRGPFNSRLFKFESVWC